MGRWRLYGRSILQFGVESVTSVAANTRYRQFEGPQRVIVAETASNRLRMIQKISVYRSVSPIHKFKSDAFRAHCECRFPLHCALSGRSITPPHCVQKRSDDASIQ